MLPDMFSVEEVLSLLPSLCLFCPENDEEKNELVTHLSILYFLDEMLGLECKLKISPCNIQIRPGLNANEIHAPYGRHHKVSTLINV